jgi:hypothetical protein
VAPGDVTPDGVLLIDGEIPCPLRTQSKPEVTSQRRMVIVDEELNKPPLWLSYPRSHAALVVLF